ncbi:hypothetical protein [Bdellovibrio bacteriovorus]|uniref:Uncharacterized protein n=1 Tax=Bdellovibrio bacteriovorus str. Tiberius TaxID=1069642 RepID=K7Z6I2_BDEBC|nr:hypothetical protein [Bdellovibrio bacteriovorus]AFX99818.1 hypothetical protein Bdt_0109 [Bdellovibrio bacteriovorus str. Tiberius]
MKRHVNNNKGQFLVESVLLMTFMVGALIWATGQLRENKYLAKLISSPWQKVSGMIESGVWDTPENARAKHPNQVRRSLTAEP